MPASSLGFRATDYPSSAPRTSSTATQLVLNIADTPARHIRQWRQCLSLLTCMALVASAVGIGIWAALTP